MAKEGVKAREVKRARLVAKYADKREALKAAGDFEALDKLPKNSSPVRLHNRCKLTGRPRGYMRQFGISRVTFRDMALAGKIPGVRKASWQESLKLKDESQVKRFCFRLYALDFQLNKELTMAGRQEQVLKETTIINNK